MALESSSIEGATPTYFAVFSYRKPDSDSEQLCVAYLPANDVASSDAQRRVSTSDAIRRVVLLQAGAVPEVLPLDHSVLQKSTLGKLSRGKIKSGLLSGALRPYQERHRADVAYVRLRQSAVSSDPTSFERRVLDVVVEVMARDKAHPLDLIGIDTPLIELGVSSIQILQLKSAIARDFDVILPLSIAINNPTARTLARAVQQHLEAAEYNPVTALRESGHQTPLWLVHPGIGEVLVFLGLSQLINDRPVYGLRARGFGRGEAFFSSIDEIVSTYVQSIQQKQRVGPYALAGYSYGSMIAFEIAKRLEDSGETVAFLGIFNLPPHIKTRMRQLGWLQCILHLAFFLDLFNEPVSMVLEESLRDKSRGAIVEEVFSQASDSRLQELSLSRTELRHWADLAFAMQSMATDYEPKGNVAVLDVFYCEPLRVVAPSKEVWLRDHLSKWTAFCRTECRMHEVGGSHYTMLAADQVHSFQQTLHRALHGRGI